MSSLVRCWTQGWRAAHVQRQCLEDIRINVGSSATVGHIQPLILKDLKVEATSDMLFGSQFWGLEIASCGMGLEFRCVATIAFRPGREMAQGSPS